MKNNKKTNNSWVYTYWDKYQIVLKKTFIFVILLILFILSLTLVWKQYKDRAILPQVNFQALTQENNEQKSEEKQVRTEVLSSSQSELDTIKSRLDVLEQKATQQHPLSPISHKLVGFELFKGVLEGLIPIEILKAYLERTPDEWAKSYLTALIPINTIKSYGEIETLLIISPSPSSQPHSLWQRFKQVMAPLIQIRKKENRELHHFNNIRNFLHVHDLKSALEVFETLPSQEKAQLNSWKEAAQNRFLLEMSTQKLLRELTEG